MLLLFCAIFSQDSTEICYRNRQSKNLNFFKKNAFSFFFNIFILKLILDPLQSYAVRGFARFNWDVLTSNWDVLTSNWGLIGTY